MDDKKPNTTLICRVPESLKKAVEEEASRRGKTLSELVRISLRKELGLPT